MTEGLQTLRQCLSNTLKERPAIRLDNSKHCKPKIGQLFQQQIIAWALEISGCFRYHEANNLSRDLHLKDYVDAYLSGSGDLGLEEALLLILSHLIGMKASDYLSRFDQYLPFLSAPSSFFPRPTSSLFDAYSQCLNRNLSLPVDVVSTPSRYLKEKQAGFIGLVNEVQVFLSNEEDNEQNEAPEDDEYEEEEVDEEAKTGEENDNEEEDEEKMRDEQKESKNVSNKENIGPRLALKTRNKVRFMTSHENAKRHPREEPSQKKQKISNSSSLSSCISEEPFGSLNSVPPSSGDEIPDPRMFRRTQTADKVQAFFKPLIKNLSLDTENPQEEMCEKTLAIMLMANFVKLGYNLGDSAALASSSIPRHPDIIQKWYRSFISCDFQFLSSLRGKHPKIKSSLTDMEISSRCREYIEDNIKAKPPITASSFQAWINKTFAKQLEDGEKKHEICLSTANSYLHKLGYYYAGYDKGIVASHERSAFDNIIQIHPSHFISGKT